jgi:predicted dehydrogenase
MKYRAAIVGCGRIGCQFDDDPKRTMVSTHAGAYDRSPKVDLVALVDADVAKLARAGQRWGVSACYADYTEMLAREKPDILSVCIWNNHHLEVVRAAVAHGVRAVFCEKPLADTLAGADEMIRLCRDNHVVLQVNHQRRFDEFQMALRDHLAAGKLGRLQQAVFYYTGGVANTGSHLFDLLRFLFGDAVWVQASASQNESPNPADPNLDGVVKFQSGLTCAVLACDVKDYLIFELDIIGSTGRLNVTQSGLGLEVYTAVENAKLSGYRDLALGQTPPGLDPDVPRYPMENAVAHLIRCLEEGRESVSSGADDRASMEIIAAFHESAAAAGKRIDLPLAGSDFVLKSL